MQAIGVELMCCGQYCLKFYDNKVQFSKKLSYLFKTIPPNISLIFDCFQFSIIVGEIVKILYSRLKGP